MSTLPPGWAETTLGATCRIVSGSTPKSSEPRYWNGKIPWITPDDLSRDKGKFIAQGRRQITSAGFDSCSARMVPAGTVLYTSRAPIGYVAIASQAVCTNQGFKSLVPPTGIRSDFLYWYMRYATGLIKSRASGTTFAEISGKAMAAIPLFVAPTAEQARIVAAIEEQSSRIDAGAAALDRVRARVRRMRAVVLRAAVTGALVPQLPADGDAEPVIAAASDARRKAFSVVGQTSAAPIAFAQRGLPSIPASWRWASLDSLAEVVGGITKDAKRETASGLVQVPYLRVANVQRGHLDLGDVATIGATAEQIEVLRLRSGDILFNEGGDRDKLGRGWVWEGQIDPCIHQNHVFRARLYAPVLDPRLVSWHGNTFGQNWFSVGGKQTTNLASVSKTTLRSFPVPVPPLAEQRRIVAAVEVQLSVIDAIEAMLETIQRRSSSLRSSVLSFAFAGRLVAQDRNDEPASTLLQRLVPEGLQPMAAIPVTRTPQVKITA